MPKLTFIDLFAGVGGLSMPFRNLGAQCVFSSEWDANCQKTYQMNFNEKPSGDIMQINSQNIPHHDLLLAGFPCQPFSIAGLRGGFNDKRGCFIFKILEILKMKQPRFFILENVKNLISHNNQKTFNLIIKELKKLNYFIKYKILNSKKFNIPQNRERVFIVGFKNKSDYWNFNFPMKVSPQKKKISDFINLESIVQDKYYYNHNKYNALLQDARVDEFTFYQIRRVYVRVNKNQLCPTLTANMGTGGHNVPIIWTKNGFRKLTPRECFTLQGFPKNFQLPQIADSYLYKQAGNSVTLNVIRPLAQKINEVISMHED